MSGTKKKIAKKERQSKPKEEPLKLSLVLLLSFPRCWADCRVVLSLDLSEVSYKNAPDFLHVMYNEKKRENLIKSSFML